MVVACLPKERCQPLAFGSIKKNAEKLNCTFCSKILRVKESCYIGQQISFPKSLISFSRKL